MKEKIITNCERALILSLFMEDLISLEEFKALLKTIKVNTEIGLANEKV